MVAAALLVISAIVISGCISGQTIRRQAADAPIDYDDNPSGPAVQQNGTAGDGCQELWHCDARGACAGGAESRVCYDLNQCNKTRVTETRACRPARSCYSKRKHSSPGKPRQDRRLPP